MSSLGGFSECSGLEMTLEVEEYKEGGSNGARAQVPDPRHLVAHRAQARHGRAATALWDWHYGFADGKGKRRDGVIVLLERPARADATSGTSAAACR